MPFASYGFDGTTTFSPAVWTKWVSGDCEW